MPLLNEINVKGVPHPIVTDDGYYQNITVGDAEQLVGTVFEEDDTAFNFRTTGGSAEVGDRAYVESITGGSLPWNQKILDGDFPSGSNRWNARQSTITISDNIATVVPTSDGTDRGLIRYIGNDTIPSHVYFFSVTVLSPVSSNLSLSFSGTPDASGLNKRYVTADTWTKCDVLWKNSTVVTNANYYALVGGTVTTEQSIKFKNAMLIDLTAMFGSTIADYIYGLETAHAGDGVAWFRRYFPKPYYAYHAVGMEHVNAVSAKTVGFNQWDEEWASGYYDNSGAFVANSGFVASKNKIKCFPNTEYYFLMPDIFQLFYYDANGDFLEKTSSMNPNIAPTARRQTTPNGAYFVNFYIGGNYGGTYKNDISISIRWDNSRDGDYEPYNLHTYPLADITLRGIPKLVDGDLVYDGDRYLADGTVERNKAEVTYDGSSDENWDIEPGTVDDYYRFYIAKNDMKKETNYVGALIATLPVVRSYTYFGDFTGDIAVTAYSITIYDTNWMYIISKSLSTVADLRTYLAAHPLTIIYPLKTPTTEEADPYQYPMVVDNWGTEEFVDGLVESGDRDVAIPVGHETKYPPNLKDKLESAANNPDSDGEYILKHDGGSNTYIPLSSNATIQNIIARLEALEGGGENE